MRLVNIFCEADSRAVRGPEAESNFWSSSTSAVSSVVVVMGPEAISQASGYHKRPVYQLEVVHELSQVRVSGQLV